MIKLPPYRYIKDRSVSDYTYSAHADGYDECLEHMRILLTLHGIPYREPDRCTKEDLRASGLLEGDE